MPLYCTICPAPMATIRGGGAACPHHGFASLACGRCHKIVPKGLAYCPNCSDVIGPKEISTVRASEVSAPPTISGLPSLPGLEIDKLVVPDVYKAGRFGVEADVQMNGRDAEILTKMNQVALMLHALAAEMNQFQDVMDSTRRAIKACRHLATELQEEVEIRKGPGR